MIRKLTKNDVEECYQLRLEGLKNEPTAFLTSYEEELSKGPGFFDSILSSDKEDNVIFGAFSENVLVGMIGVYSDRHSKSRHKATIWGVYIKPAFRGKKIGKSLITQVVEHAKAKMGAGTLYLSVESTNESAKKLYMSCGFNIWGREPRSLCVDGVFYDEDYLYLHLGQM